MAFILRYALAHMIEETARHCGHLDRFENASTNSRVSSPADPTYALDGYRSTAFAGRSQCFSRARSTASATQS
jgi:hypothetical protein